MKHDNLYTKVAMKHHYSHHALRKDGLDPEKSVWEQKEKFTWGSYGKNREHRLLYKPLTSLSTDHLQNILKTEKWISEIYEWLIHTILEDRNENRAPKELFEL